ncbi:MAG: diphthine--ammonia ligase [Pseudomonadota bacterium]
MSSLPAKTYFNWSSGKDSALALHYLRQDEQYSIDLLLTSVNQHFDRVTMHGLRRELLEAQIQSVGIDVVTLELPEQPSMEVYEDILSTQIRTLHSQGYTHSAFGDIFLEDLRVYREQQLTALGMQPVFPIWQRDTRELIHEFLDLGFQAIIVCAKAACLNQDFAGRVLDNDFLKDLPASVDPCGENGEFHTFCFDGPIFQHPITFEVGETVHRAYKNPDANEADMGFWYCDLLPAAV